MSFIIDKIAPQINISGVTENGIYQEIAPLISVHDTYLDNSKTAIMLNNVLYTSGTVITNERKHVIKVIAYDLAGNSSEKSISFDIQVQDLYNLLLFYASYNTSLNADMAEGNPTNYESYGKRTDEKGGYNKQGLYAFPRGFHF